MQHFKDKVVVVTGAGAGIGRATALAFAREGAHIVAAERDPARAEATAAAAAALGPAALAVTCDVGREEDLVNLRAAALAKFGRIDILMNNVGLVVSGAFLDVTPDHWRKSFDVNVVAPVRAIQLMLPDIEAQGEGHVINVASTAALYPYNTDRMPYNATKVALVNFSEALAMELRPRNIGVTLLLPGPVQTSIAQDIVTVTPNNRMMSPELPLKQPEEVGDMVVAAVRNGVFFLPTNAEVHAIVAARGQDPEGFLRAATQRFVERRSRAEDRVVG
jgi:NAD(P)-dependent dehydrogenase (short-subunit alcohol dehydrogenase family)